VPTKKSDDEWLSLDEPTTSPEPKVSTSVPSPDVAKKALKTTSAISEPPNPPPSFSASASPTTPTTNAAKPRSIFDDDLPDLAPLQAQANAVPLKSLPPDLEPEAISGPQKKVPEVTLSSPALSPDFAIPTTEQFQFPCRVCGTVLFTQTGRVGQSIRCPDCYSELLVPPPKTKVKPKEIKLDEAPNVALAPIEARNSKVNSPESNTKAIMEKAAVDAEQEREQYDSVNSVFDTKRWMGLLFGFMHDPFVILAIVGLGLAVGCWFMAIMAMGTWISMEVAQAAIARIGLFVIFFIPLSILTCMCGLSVLTMAANRAPKVNEWPFSRMGDAWGECLFVLASLVITSIPGGMIGLVLGTLQVHPMLRLGAILLSIWGIGPVVLLSMIQNGSITQPYSKRVNDSISAFSDAWGAMYMQSGLAYFGIFCLLLMSYSRGPIGCGLLGFLIPFFVLFIFNQIGVLAGRVSSALELGFDGDFSDDQ
jgi:uncharacterized Zn finger protein (UPF0148 family)